jgi:hypothetical protein
MDIVVQIGCILVGAGLFGFVVMPGFLLLWDRVLDHIRGGVSRKKEE